MYRPSTEIDFLSLADLLIIYHCAQLHWGCGDYLDCGFIHCHFEKGQVMKSQEDQIRKL